MGFETRTRAPVGRVLARVALVEGVKPALRHLPVDALEALCTGRTIVCLSAAQEIAFLDAAELAIAILSRRAAA